MKQFFPNKFFDKVNVMRVCIKTNRNPIKVSFTENQDMIMETSFKVLLMFT
jgi:hypothetical protein